MAEPIKAQATGMRNRQRLSLKYFKAIVIDIKK
jgi:hypothetical protein